MKRKIYEKTASCTAKLSVINGMYPETSCNHRMRRSGHQLDEVIEKERINWKAKRESQKIFKVFIASFSQQIVVLLENKRHSDQLAKQRLEAGFSSVSERLKNTDIETYQQLKSLIIS